MADEWRLGGLEERVSQLEKRLERHESAVEREMENLRGGMRQQFESLEKLLRGALTSAVEVQEARQAVVRSVVYGACTIILVFVLQWLLADRFNGPKFPPQQPPAHSTKEIRQ